MKTEDQVLKAREAVIDQLLRTDLNEMQRTFLKGASVALQWTAEEGGAALQWLVDGNPVVAKG